MAAKALFPTALLHITWHGLQRIKLWMLQLEWPPIIHELGLGHPMKFIWEGVS